MCLQLNQNTKRMEYEGAVLHQVTCMADLPHGGQILVDEATFDGIKSSLATLRERVAKGPNLASIAANCRCGPHGRATWPHSIQCRRARQTTSGWQQRPACSAAENPPGHESQHAALSSHPGARCRQTDDLLAQSSLPVPAPTPGRSSAPSAWTQRKISAQALLASGSQKLRVSFNTSLHPGQSPSHSMEGCAPARAALWASPPHMRSS